MSNRFIFFVAVACIFVVSPNFVRAQNEANTAVPVGTLQPQGPVLWGTRDMAYHGKNYDVLDSNYVPKYRKGQLRRFLGHEYIFPPKPRSMWEIGFGGGLYNVLGDVPSLFPWQKGGYALDLHVRKAWGYIFSTRLEYDYGIAKGLGYQLEYHTMNPAWTSYNANNLIVNNYRMESHQLNLDLIFNVANIDFHRAKSSVIFYGYVGLGALAFKTRVNTGDANGNPYDFASIIGTTNQTYANRNVIRKKLQSAMDNDYDMPAEDQTRTKAKIFDGKTLDWCPSFGAGMQVRLNKRMNLQIEDRLSVPDNEDLLDGVRWASSSFPQLTINNDVINYFSIGLNFNIGNKHKNVEPLYWMNPLDFAYSELNNPRHMILPEPIISDVDSDGVPDQLDKCANTPKGTRVDSHGCPMDTDGDGVPDYLDKQLITPTECQPVDASGVGKCPCPDACKALLATSAASCSNISSDGIDFPKNTVNVSAKMQTKLNTLAAQMRANPACKVTISGLGNNNKLEQQRSWDRVNNIVQYMTEKQNIDRNRFIFQYGQSGEANRVEYRPAMVGEEGPSNVAPPFPDMIKK